MSNKVILLAIYRFIITYIAIFATYTIIMYLYTAMLHVKLDYAKAATTVLGSLL